MVAFVLPAGLRSLLFPFMICNETPRATTFDLNDGISVIWIKHFVDANLLLYFVVLNHIFLHHCMARIRGKTCQFLYY
jgi:hypothetical protein